MKFALAGPEIDSHQWIIIDKRVKIGFSCILQIGCSADLSAEIRISRIGGEKHSMERRKFLKSIVGAVSMGAAQILSFKKDEGIRLGELRPELGLSQAEAICGRSYNCTGGAGQCGTSFNCAGGGGECGSSYNCSGGGGKCGSASACAGGPDDQGFGGKPGKSDTGGLGHGASKCGIAYDCAGSGGKCGVANNCGGGGAGGIGKCGAGYSCGGT